MSRPPRHGRRGFTLIEALAAIGVLVIVIPVLLQGFTIAGSIAMDARQTAEATALAQSTMDELIATQNWMFGSASGEDTFIPPTHYSWFSTLDNYETEVNVQTLTITVQWMRLGRQRQVQLATVVYIPGSTVQSTSNSLLGATPLGGGP